MMKKKLIVGLLCLCLAGAAAGCGKKDSNEENNSQQEVNVSANVELGSYKGVEVTMLSTKVTEEEVAKELESFVTKTKLVRTDRTDVQMDDIANINYSGKVDGEAFSGGTDDSEDGTDLVIGSNQFIEGFEDQVIGHKVGETFDINVTFPEEYRKEGQSGSELNGKDAVFTVTINSIKRYATMDDLTDQFVAENDEDSDSIEAWKKAKEEELKKEKETAAENQFKSDAIQAVIDASVFKDDLTEKIAALEKNMKSYYESYASMFGTDLTTFVTMMMGMTEEQFNTEVKNASEFYVKQEIIGNKIIQEENLALTDEEYTTGLAELATEANADTPEAYETENGKEVIQQQLLLNKAFQLIFDNAVKKEPEEA